MTSSDCEDTFFHWKEEGVICGCGASPSMRVATYISVNGHTELWIGCSVCHNHLEIRVME